MNVIKLVPHASRSRNPIRNMKAITRGLLKSRFNWFEGDVILCVGCVHTTTIVLFDFTQFIYFFKLFADLFPFFVSCSFVDGASPSAFGVRAYRSDLIGTNLHSRFELQHDRFYESRVKEYTQPTKKALTVAVTGAAGQIGYSLLFRLARCISDGFNNQISFLSSK